MPTLRSGQGIRHDEAHATSSNGQQALPGIFDKNFAATGLRCSRNVE